MFRNSLRNVARGTSVFRSPRQVGRVSLAARIPAPRLHVCSQKYLYSTAADGKTAPTQKPDKKELDESLLNMDIDVAEKHVKDWLGDHATWDHEKLRNLVYVDRLIRAPDILRFADYAIGGYRPDGGRASFPLLSEEEIELMGTPYYEWAPAPYDSRRYSCNGSLLPLFGQGTGTGDGNDLKTPPFVNFFARLHPLRAKLWHGMVPISRARWLERKMDDPANYRNLRELMKDILDVFAWLNHEDTLGRMRAGFNWLVDKYVEFEEAANARREKNGLEERLDLAGMWAEYYHAVISVMSNRTHAWLVDRVEEVQTRAFAEYTKALEEAGSDQEAIGAAGKKYYECAQDLNSMMTRADYTLDIPMVGFKGYTPSGTSASDLSLPLRQDSYRKIAQTKSWTHQEKLLQEQDREEAEAAAQKKKPDDMLDYVEQLKKGGPPAGPRFRDHESFIGHYHEGRKNRAEVRRALRGEKKALGEEYWITILRERMNFYLANGKDPKTHRWGFVCYRLTYKQDDAEWADFKRKFEADVFKSGEWIEGYDSIADMAGLEYIDGRDVGIPEGDIEAAKRHFKSTYTMLPSLGRMWAQDFLVIDHQSYASYDKLPPEEKRPPPPFGPCFGDRGGFVRLVDTTEQQPREVLDVLSPGYKGELKMLSSLVLEEVYPMLATLALRPGNMWPLARLHPREVYVGQTDEAQEAWWEFNRIDAVSMNKFFFEQMRKKKAALLEKK